MPILAQGFKKRPKDMGYLFVVGGPGGSGSSTIAKLLARHFGLHYVYGGALMREYVQKYGYDDLSKFLQSDDFANTKGELDQIVDWKILKASNWNDVLIDSKVFAGIATNLQISCTVKLWLNCSLHTRVRRTLHKDRKIDLSKKLPRYSEIYKITQIKLRDRYYQDKYRYKKLYGIEYDKPEKYNDIVLDTSHLNEGATMQLILDRIERGGYLE